MGDLHKTAHSARLRLVHGEDCEGCQDIGVQKALHIVHLAGWRIVRTSTCQCEAPDSEHGDGDHRLDAYPCEERIVDEWTPDAGGSR